MTVIPTVNGANVTITCGNGHTNPLRLADVSHPTGSFSVVTITCPTCGEGSGHPITGGADQAHVQALYLAAVAANGCPCGALTAGKAAAIVRSHLRSHAQQLGAGFVA
jgi:hypothetical protein